MNRKDWGWLLLIVGAPTLIGLVAWNLDPLPAWVISMGVLAAFIIVAGLLITKVGKGAFVDQRNKVSLSRFQTALWMVLVLSAFLTAAISNLRMDVPGGITVAVPQELWVVLGISATSLVGSGLVKEVRGSQQTDPVAVAAAQGLPVEQVKPVGNTAVLVDSTGAVQAPLPVLGELATNVTVKDASWADMLKLEDVGKGAYLDLGKVQMFFFTVLLVLTYGVAIARLFANGGPFDSLPSLDPGFVALLAISQGAYLVNKTVPAAKTPATPTATPTAQVGGAQVGGAQQTLDAPKAQSIDVKSPDFLEWAQVQTEGSAAAALERQLEPRLEAKPRNEGAAPLDDGGER
jgi:hypothetical protein